MRRLVAMLAVLALVTSACGSGDSLEVDNVWARASANMQNAGAVYMTITGGDDADTLVGVAVDSSVAAVAELHESSMDDEGTMTMQQVAGIDVPAGDDVMLEPGGFHVMLMQLAEPLVDGMEFTVTLTFEEAGDVEVDVTVEEG